MKAFTFGPFATALLRVGAKVLGSGRGRPSARAPCSLQLEQLDASEFPLVSTSDIAHC